VEAAVNAVNKFGLDGQSDLTLLVSLVITLVFAAGIDIDWVESVFLMDLITCLRLF
jgi:hypothetical protein